MGCTTKKQLLLRWTAQTDKANVSKHMTGLEWEVKEVIMAHGRYLTQNFEMLFNDFIKNTIYLSWDRLQPANPQPWIG